MKTATFGTVLRRYRLAAGLTQAELAHQAHLAEKTVAALEAGRRNMPRPDTVRMLAEALDLSGADLSQFQGAAGRRMKLSPGSEYTEVADASPTSELILPAEQHGEPQESKALPNSASLVVPEGHTPQARAAVADFWDWYRPVRARVLDRAMKVSLRIILWRPIAEPDGPVARKRHELHDTLHAYGHRVVYATVPTQIEGTTVELPESAELHDADLIVALVEDDPVAIEEVLCLCSQADVLHNVYALIPQRYRFTISDVLDSLIHGYHGVYWYEDYDIGASNLLREALKCSEARRKVKALRQEAAP